MELFAGSGLIVFIADQIVLAEERQQLLTKLRQAVADYLQVSASIVQITLN